MQEQTARVKQPPITPQIVDALVSLLREHNWAPEDPDLVGGTVSEMGLRIHFLPVERVLSLWVNNEGGSQGELARFSLSKEQAAELMRDEEAHDYSVIAEAFRILVQRGAIMRWDKAIEEGTKIVTLSVELTPGENYMTIVQLNSPIPSADGTQNGPVSYFPLTDEQVLGL